MLISPGRWAIITPPKTGSTSLRSHFVDLYSGNQHDVNLPCDFSGRIFVTTRNPFARAVSLWRHYLWDCVHKEGLRAVYELKDPISFEGFLAIRQQLSPFFGPACWWIRDLRRPYTKLPLETIDAALQAAGLLDVGQTIPQLNRTRHDPIASYYAKPALAHEVIRQFCDDFAEFGYAAEISRDVALV